MTTKRRATVRLEDTNSKEKEAVAEAAKAVLLADKAREDREKSEKHGNVDDAENARKLEKEHQETAEAAKAKVEAASSESQAAHDDVESITTELAALEFKREKADELKAIEEEGEEGDEEITINQEGENPEQPSTAWQQGETIGEIIVPPKPKTSEAVEDTKDELDEDEAKFVAVVEAEKRGENIISKNDNAPTATQAAVQVQECISDDVLKDIFSTMDHGSVKGQLNPMLFASLIRAVTNSTNLYTEMKLFSKFNTSGDGVIDTSEFVEGVKEMFKESGPNTLFYKGLLKYHEQQSCIL